MGVGLADARFKTAFRNATGSFNLVISNGILFHLRIVEMNEDRGPRASTSPGDEETTACRRRRDRVTVPGAGSLKWRKNPACLV